MVSEKRFQAGTRFSGSSAAEAAVSSPLARQVQNTIRRFAMLSEGDRVLVAVSGGPDSIALLYVLLALRLQLGLELAMVHVNHGLRGAAAENEEAQVQALGHSLELRLHVHRLALEDRKGSLEERSRDARYAIFEQLAAEYGYSRVAIGHQAEDNAEAVLMNLLRGSGSRGLSGIPPVRQRIIRPLIECRRSQILAYLHELAIPYAIDASNADPRFERNRIRHRLIPLLEQQYSARIVRILNRTAGLCRDEEVFWREYLRPLTEQVEICAKTGLEMPVQLIAPLARPVQRRLLREALRLWRGDLRRIGAGHVDRVLESLVDTPRDAALRLPNAILVRRVGDRLHFVRAPRRDHRAKDDGTSFLITITSAQTLPRTEDMPESWGQLEFRMVEPPTDADLNANDPDRAWFDLDRLSFPMYVRWPQTGDRLRPFGMTGHQTVSKLLSNHKIPSELRRRVPVLLGGGTLLWVVGVRRAAAAPVNRHTARVLQVCRVAKPHRTRPISAGP